MEFGTSFNPGRGLVMTTVVTSWFASVYDCTWSIIWLPLCRPVSSQTVYDDQNLLGVHRSVFTGLILYLVFQGPR